MNSQTIILSLLAVVILIVAGLAVWLAFSKMRSNKLRKKFGPEYEYTIEKTGDRRTAEALLTEREKRVSELNIRALSPDELERYQAEWLHIQADFLDVPAESVNNADSLIKEVMLARGFPVVDFEHRLEDISVLYPNVVSNYRSAHDIALKNQDENASTEELRQAMIYYRSLYQELLGAQNSIQEAQTKEAMSV